VVSRLARSAEHFDRYDVLPTGTAVAALLTLFMGAAAGIYSILFLIAQIGLATKDRLVR
jgi:hypothetical protein